VLLSEIKDEVVERTHSTGSIIRSFKEFFGGV